MGRQARTIKANSLDFCSAPESQMESEAEAAAAAAKKAAGKTKKGSN
ncbi:MAG: hypothetical protein R2848_11325 [Thermomicrobiales bacterium]